LTVYLGKSFALYHRQSNPTIIFVYIVLIKSTVPRRFQTQVNSFFPMYLPLTQITLQLTFAFFFFLNHQFLKPVKNEQAISLLSLFLCCISFLARSTYNMQDALLNVLLVKINIHGAGTNFSCIRNHAFTVPTLQS